MRKLRVATYNVHKCQGMDRRVMPGRIADVIAEFRPDIVGLQEVLSIEGGAPEAHQARFIAGRLGFNLEIGEVRELRGGIYGNVLLSRFPMRNVCTVDLSVPGRERRGCVHTDVELEDGIIVHVYNFHLGTGFMERRVQARKIIETELMRSKQAVGPRIVMGDFNEWTRGLVSATLAAEFKTADIRRHLKVKRSYPGFLPLLHLDHIYYDEDLVVERVFLHRSLRSLIASDHLPLVADFAVRSNT